MTTETIDLDAIRVARERLGELARVNPNLVDKEADQDELLQAWMKTLGGLMERKPMYSVEEVADMMGVHSETVRRAIKDGGLKAAKLGRSIRISSIELERWFRECGGGKLWPGTEDKDESLDEASSRFVSIAAWPPNSVLNSLQHGAHGAAPSRKVTFILPDQRHFRCDIRRLAGGGFEVCVFAPVKNPGTITKPIRRYVGLETGADDVAHALRHFPDDPCVAFGARHNNH